MLKKKKKNKIDTKINKKVYWVYSIIIILFFEWFYNHPSLRYGGYSLITLILFVPFTIYASKFVLIKYLKEKIVFLIILSLIIFVGRNINRIHNEVQKYNYDLLSYPFYNLDENHFRISSFINKILANHQNCTDETKISCGSFEGISISKKNNYYFLTRSK